MNISRRRKSNLSTVRTARSIAGLFVASGFFMLILSVIVGAILFQTDINGTSVDTFLNSVAPATDQPVNAEPAGKRIDVIKASIDTQNIKSSVSSVVSALEWNDVWRLLIAAFMIFWLGYVLRVMAVLAETQLIDFQRGD